MAENSKRGMAYDTHTGWPNVDLVIGTAKDGTPLYGDAVETAPDGYGTVYATYHMAGENALSDAKRICEAWNAMRP